LRPAVVRTRMRRRRRMALRLRSRLLGQPRLTVNLRPRVVEAVVETAAEAAAADEAEMAALRLEQERLLPARRLLMERRFPMVRLAAMALLRRLPVVADAAVGVAAVARPMAAG
jgi:hypothetical protein